MRTNPLTCYVAMLAAAVVGCLEQSEPVVAVDSQPIIGGTVDTGDPAVVMLRGGGFVCTGALVAPNVVLTAGHCLQNAARTAYFGTDYGSFFAQRDIATCYAARNYVYPGMLTGKDIALCRLTEDAPAEVEPLPMNREPLDQSYVGAEIRSVGFGIADPVAESGVGTKRQVSYSISGVLPDHVLAGDSTYNICGGDSGGPTFHSFDGTERIIAVHSYGMNCAGASGSTRVDVHLDRFIQEVMDAWYGPCKLDGACVTEGCTTPDPDCVDCGFDGRCDTGCAKKDLDCPIGVFAGGFCDDHEDCEELLCVTAPDDDRVHYCSMECDPDRPEDNYGCDPPLNICQDDGTGTYVCRYPGPTPSVQGAPCDESGDCRSQICDHEDGICVEECGDGLPECPEGYTCDGVSPEVDACVLPRKDEGCRIGRAVGRGRGGSPWLLGILALGLAAASKKRRIRSSQ